MVWMSDVSIDYDSLVDTGNYIQQLKLYPYFDAAHYTLVCLSVRDDLGPNAIAFSRKHPFSLWMSCILMSFAGSFLSSFLLGEPIISPFKRHNDVILATIVWYFMFFSPFDLVYKLVKLSIFKIPLCMAKEVQRAYKISHGVKYAGKLYPESYLVQVLVGMSKGAGSGVVKVLEQLVRGTWSPTNHEILKPSFTSKACLIASIVFTLERNSMYVTAPHDLVHLCVVGFFIYFKLAQLLLRVENALAPVENVACAFLLGGVFDAFARAVGETKESMQKGKKLSEDELLEKEREKEVQRKRSQQNGVDKKNN